MSGSAVQAHTRQGNTHERVLTKGINVPLKPIAFYFYLIIHFGIRLPNIQLQLITSSTQPCLLPSPHFNINHEVFNRH
jgi:hypothetical protein